MQKFVDCDELVGQVTCCFEVDGMIIICTDKCYTVFSHYRPFNGSDEFHNDDMSIHEKILLRNELLRYGAINQEQFEHLERKREEEELKRENREYQEKIRSLHAAQERLGLKKTPISEIKGA